MIGPTVAAENGTQQTTKKSCPSGVPLRMDFVNDEEQTNPETFQPIRFGSEAEPKGMTSGSLGPEALTYLKDPTALETALTKRPADSR
jgi:hypothetical protein